MQVMTREFHAISDGFGIPFAVFKKICLFYLFLQFVIWAKVAVYFFFTGAGQIPTTYSYYLFVDPVYFFKSFLSFNYVQRFDLLFHQSMHFLIAFTLFVFARHSSKHPFFLLLKIFTLAAILHNAGYWFTNIFPTIDILLFDFVTDIGFLFLFYYFFSWLNGFRFVKNTRAPLLE